MAENLDEVAGVHGSADHFPVNAKRGNEGREGNSTGINEQLAHFTNTADVFGAICVAKTQVDAQAMAHIVAVEHISPATTDEKGFLDAMGEGRFSRPGETREP